MGSVLVRLTGSLLSVFYIAAGLHFIYAFLVIAIIPESLSMRRMLQSRRLYAEQVEAANQAQGKRGAWAAFKKIFKFLSPLSLFYQTPAVTDGNPLRRPKKDWNLALVAISFGCMISIMVSSIIISIALNCTE